MTLKRPWGSSEQCTTNNINNINNNNKQQMAGLHCSPAKRLNK